ncbi:MULTISPECIES: MlaD family protein [unclassified Gordonia (in: high G+C Gram-positive bacteria)]|uniref:MlaD family protein n=1 Tax=unclassified Gordonia (in: high G+C Gram-positive bacteria) TaxID=2657482 RepID=UPI0020003136|nr:MULTISPECIES: MlaD family protein [unclassified Gordonia (in: high G+C Gram-positive bacteria)]UQE75928.1 MCE family protein [Gordonia sp. PP30]
MTTLSVTTAIKAFLFVLVGLLAAVLVVNTLRVPLRGPADGYVLMFTDAEGLTEGNPVKMSGVRIGRVESVTRQAQPGGTALAKVTVRIERSHPVPQRVRAAIRYGDMLGARYIALSPGDESTPERRGAQIPVAATTAPIDLTALMNGFQPLFASLKPREVNELAQGFVDTFAGRTKSVELLLRQIGSLGANLRANNAVFARLVTNLNTLMTAAEEHSGELGDLFSGLGRLTSAIVGDDGDFTRLISSGDRALSALAQMMTAGGDSFAGALSGLTDVTAAWIPQTGKFETFLTRLPALADKLNHSGRYGGFMMLYLCNFTLKAGDLEANIFGPLHSPVCR